VAVEWGGACECTTPGEVDDIRKKGPVIRDTVRNSETSNFPEMLKGDR